jgi:hypothetical protein
MAEEGDHVAIDPLGPSDVEPIGVAVHLVGGRHTRVEPALVVVHYRLLETVTPNHHDQAQLGEDVA